MTNETNKTPLTIAMDSIKAIDSNQYGYGKYRTRIDNCFEKITENDMEKLAQYGLFQLAVQDEGSQDALLTAFRAGFLSPKQQKATGTKPVVATANVPTTSRDFLSRRLESALKAFGDSHAELLCGGLGPHALEWDWETLMMDNDFEADYRAIASYESRFSRFVASLPYKPTAWRPVSDSLVELSINLATFATITPTPESARFENGMMTWVIPVKDVPVQEPVEPEPVQEPTPEPVQEPEAVKPKATPKATAKAKA